VGRFAAPAGTTRRLDVATELAAAVAELEVRESSGELVTRRAMQDVDAEWLFEARDHHASDWSPMVDAAARTFGRAWAVTTRSRLIRLRLELHARENDGAPLPLWESRAQRQGQASLARRVALILDALYAWWDIEVRVAWLMADGWDEADARRVVGAPGNGEPLFVWDEPWREIAWMVQHCAWTFADAALAVAEFVPE
jgi:hypothetical protein